MYDRSLKLYRRRYYRRDIKFKKQRELSTILRKIYKEYHIYEEVGFPDLYSDKGSLLRFDTMIPELGLLIEYQGRGHFEFIKYIHRTKKAYKRLLLHDQMKRDYIENSSYTLVEFTYKEPVDKEDFVESKIEEAIGAKGD